ncbi:MAG: response regulator [Alphaproteobacteria bacterium]|nr:response regulator [Alphaproteobacteria bacterium]
MPYLWVPIGLLLIVSLLSVRSLTPEQADHERIIDAIRLLTLNDTALQRDALEARAGLLPNYDPLVRAAERLRTALVELRRVDDPSFARHLDILYSRIEEREALLETFKSGNALLQNSLRYLSYTIAAPGKLGLGDATPVMTSELGRLADMMLLFMHDPRPDTTRQVNVILDRLAQLPTDDAEVAQNLSLLVKHGRLIVAALPEVDATLLGLLAVPVEKSARTLNAAYLERHARTEAMARLLQALFWLSVAALAASLGYLFYRTWARARAFAEHSRLLQSRLDAQGLVTEASTRVAMARHRADLNAAIDRTIGRLGETCGIDRAYIILLDANGVPAEISHFWCRSGIVPSASHTDDLVSMLRAPTMVARIARHERIVIPSAGGLPPGSEKTSLQRLGIAGWFGLPIFAGDRQIGLLGFEIVRGGTDWANLDIALMETTGEIVANAIDRDRTETERRELEARLRQSEKLEAIGTLASGIAHDFNSILSAILGYGDMAMLALDPQSRARRHVQEMVAAGGRAASLVDSILLFSRGGRRSRRPIRVQPIVEEAVEMLQAANPNGIAIRAKYDEGAAAAAVMGDATQLHQVIMNLCKNAIQALNSSGTVNIALGVVDVAAERSLVSGSLHPGRYVRLAVTDTGCGMDAATMERIFEPFFTTKQAGQGTGLGLATVLAIVTELNGHIDVQSQPGVGSNFDVYLSLTDAEEDVAPDYDQAATVQGRGEAVLLVDDDAPLVRLGEEMLAALGYEPVGFDSSRRALEAFLKDPMRFDIVLSDAIMPEMHGLILAAEIHRVRPELPILLMTTHNAPMHETMLRETGVCTVLKKPVRSIDLATTIAAQLAPSAMTLHR